MYNTDGISCPELTLEQRRLISMICNSLFLAEANTGNVDTFTMALPHVNMTRQAAMRLSAEQQDALVANTASMLDQFISACRVHRTLLQELTRLPMTASGLNRQHDMVRRCMWLHTFNHTVYAAIHQRSILSESLDPDVSLGARSRQAPTILP